MMRSVLLLILFIGRFSAAAAFNIHHQVHRFVSQHLIPAAMLTMTGMTMTSIAPAAAHGMEWDFMNGNVQLPNTMQLNNLKNSRISSSSSSSLSLLTLSDPTVIGVGGGGTVFSFRDSEVLLKVSWKDSTPSVERECQTLQMLQDKNVEGTEHCLGQLPYNIAGAENNKNNNNNNKDDAENEGRIMIVVEPYVRDAVASIAQLSNNKSLQIHAVQQVSRTLIQMLAANIVTIDVQPLISQSTGKVIFIDMTEAQTLYPPFGFLDQTLMASFCTEMLALIPDNFVSVASKTMREEMKALESKGITLSDEAKEVLYGQSMFFPEMQ